MSLTHVVTMWQGHLAIQLQSLRSGFSGTVSQTLPDIFLNLVTTRWLQLVQGDLLEKLGETLDMQFACLKFGGNSF